MKKQYKVLKDFESNKKGDVISMLERHAKYKVLSGHLEEKKAVAKDDRNEQKGKAS